MILSKDLKVAKIADVLTSISPSKILVKYSEIFFEYKCSKVRSTSVRISLKLFMLASTEASFESSFGFAYIRIKHLKGIASANIVDSYFMTQNIMHYFLIFVIL